MSGTSSQLNDSKNKKKESSVKDKLLNNLTVIGKILEEHGLEPGHVLKKPFVLKEVSFKGGRADIIVFGLQAELYVVPIAIEVKKRMGSLRELMNYIDQLEDAYGKAFKYIYLAIGETKLPKPGKMPDTWITFLKKYFKELGYGLITLKDDKMDVFVRAIPRKRPGNIEAYYEVVSRGTLLMATKEVLIQEKDYVNNLSENQNWVGVNTTINYCSYIHNNYAVFGVHAKGEKAAKTLSKFITESEKGVGKGGLISLLRERGYKVYLETYLVQGKGIRGYIRLLEEEPSLELFEELRKKITTIKSEKRWYLALGIYKPLWQATSPPPSYPTVLKMIQNELNALSDFKNLVKTRSQQKTMIDYQPRTSSENT